MDIDLTLQPVEATGAGDDTDQVVRKMLQSAADNDLGDWFEFAIGPPVKDLIAGADSFSSFLHSPPLPDE